MQEYDKSMHLESYPPGINVYIRVLTVYMIGMYYAIVHTYHVHGSDTYVQEPKSIDMYIHFQKSINMYIHGIYMFIHIQL